MKDSFTRRDFLLGGATIAAGAAALGTLGCSSNSGAQASTTTQEGSIPTQWNYEADVVILGGGGSGLVAALKAADEGASVLVVDANYDLGGHCAVCGGNLHFGGGTSSQKKYGIEDSADQYYLDHTTNKTLESRYNDRALIRNVANHMVETYEYIIENGVLIADAAPTGGTSTYMNGGTASDSVPRQTIVAQPEDGWAPIYTGTFDANSKSMAGKGIAITRPLEISARNKGVQFLLNYHMDTIFRSEDGAGRVVGIEASYTPTILPGETEPLQSLYSDGNISETSEKITVKANKGILVATGGHGSNVRFRTIFDPRLTEEYEVRWGEPYSTSDASGELAAMAIGASLGDTANQTIETYTTIKKAAALGCKYDSSASWQATSELFPFLGATGLPTSDFKDIVEVNLLGQRFYDESVDNFDYIAAALGSAIIDEGTADGCRRVGGPIWAIFDADAVARHKWTVDSPYVDVDGGYFFTGNTIEELASNIVNKYYEDYKMDPKVLADTISRYNGFVDAGVDDDFGKSGDNLSFKIQTPPFYAAWATPSLHDSLSGLRVNKDFQVVDLAGEPIPGLYASGESAGGHKTHGTGKIMVAGYIAGMNLAAEQA